MAKSLNGADHVGQQTSTQKAAEAANLRKEFHKKWLAHDVGGMEMIFLRLAKRKEGLALHLESATMADDYLKMARSRLKDAKYGVSQALAGAN